jgi:uncharacterized membrane protein YdjX (TVP38/TMEM64 family)
LRLLVGCLFGLVIVGGIASHRLGFADALSWADGLTRAVRETGPAGWVVFTLAQMVVAMAGIVPASLLGIAAGAVYGLFQGFLIASVGTLLGGWFAFKLARSLLRDWVEQRMARSGGRRFADLDAAVARDGWRFVCLLRISPIMPFAMTSYALGLSRIAGRDYLLGTLASLPAGAADEQCRNQSGDCRAMGAAGLERGRDGRFDPAERVVAGEMRPDARNDDRGGQGASGVRIPGC